MLGTTSISVQNFLNYIDSLAASQAVHDRVYNTQLFNSSQGKVAPPRVNTDPDVIFLKSVSNFNSEFVQPKGIRSPPGYTSMKFLIPRTYLRLHFIIFYCSNPRLDWDQLTTPIAKKMFGMVDNIACLKLPTTDARGTCLMSTSSWGVLGDCSLDM